MKNKNLKERVLLTGASGSIGTKLRKTLKPLVNKMILSDIVEPKDLQHDENFVKCDLANFKAVQTLLEGVTSIVHLGGVSVDGPFTPILNANIIGVYNLYEAARLAGVKRILFVSSNHAVGFHLRKTKLDADSVTRPDGNYGVSKVFGENLSRMYFDRYKIETVCLRIGSCFEKPIDRRMLHTWLSFRDLTNLIDVCLSQKEVGHTIHYGVSNNKEVWWDNSKSSIKYQPIDSSEQFRNEIESNLPEEDPNKLETIYQGGSFVTRGPYF